MKLKVLHNGIESMELSLNQDQEYFIGRDEACEIQLLDSKVSRKHVRIYFDEYSWKLELLSQIGHLLLNGQSAEIGEINNGDQLQIHSYTILCLIPEEAVASEEEDREEEISVEVPQEEFIDETTAGGNQSIENFLRIQYGREAEELVKISGNHWVLGRSDSSDVQLKDTKSSRKHLVIRFSGEKYFAKDLGSSNGSFLHGNQMIENKDYEIKSGDLIEIGSTQIVFEQRNPQFEEILSKLPVQVHQHAIMQVGDNQMNVGENFPSLTGEKAGPLGFIIPEQLGPKGSQERKKKIIIYAVVAILLGFAGYQTMQKEQGSRNTASSVKELKSPYEELSKEQKNYVDNAFGAAHRFFNLEQWDLSIAEIGKIHRYLPEGYSNSKMPEALSTKEMLSISETALSTLRDQERLEEEQKARAAFDAKLNEVLIECNAKLSQMTESEASICLEFVFVNRPNHPQAEAMLQKIRDREERRRQQRVRAANRQSLISKGENLFYAAKKQEKAGNVLEAIAAYQRHLNSSYEDPNGLKARSRSQLSLLKGNLSKEIEKLRRQMQNYFEADGQLKECIQTANKILRLAPDNPDALDKRAMAKARLNSSLRKDYQDSIFKEAHGEIEPAKQIWRRILVRDVEDGEYYNKASMKLKKHGGR